MKKVLKIIGIVALVIVALFIIIVIAALVSSNNDKAPETTAVPIETAAPAETESPVAEDTEPTLADYNVSIVGGEFTDDGLTVTFTWDNPTSTRVTAASTFVWYADQGDSRLEYVDDTALISDIMPGDSAETSITFINPGDGPVDFQIKLMKDLVNKNADTITQTFE